MLKSCGKIEKIPRVDENRSWLFRAGDEVVPGYHAWAVVGDGRHCETWLAWNVCLWSAVTIKLPRPNRVDERTRSALCREAQAVSPLLHPGIQRLLEANFAGDLPYLAFEYIEGPTLDEMLDDKGALSPLEVIRLGMQIASALHYIHGKGIVHGDVKPGNVVIRDGRAILIDFDIARVIGEGGAGTKARGSAPYMAPEQIEGAHAAPAMDIFALGATLYEAATSRVAFDLRKGERKDFYPQAVRRPPPPRAINPAISKALDRAIRWLLEPNPTARPATGMAALDILRRALPKSREGMWPKWVDPLMAHGAPALPCKPTASNRAAFL
jgi:eukaryotic-like serine/threonine-protein kinase